MKSFDPPRNPRADELKELTEGLRTEEASQSFGPVTQELLVYLQLQEGLGAFLDGRVEETTAQRLNEWLAQLGAFYRVQGRVRDVRGRPRSGLRVKALDRDLRNHQQPAARPNRDYGCRGLLRHLLRGR